MRLKPIVLALSCAAALTLATAVFAEEGSPGAQEVFRDGSRHYVMSQGGIPQRIYIDSMSGLRWVDANHVILPFNNAY